MERSPRSYPPTTDGLNLPREFADTSRSVRPPATRARRRTSPADRRNTSSVTAHLPRGSLRVARPPCAAFDILVLSVGDVALAPLKPPGWGGGPGSPEPSARWRSPASERIVGVDPLGLRHE